MLKNSSEPVLKALAAAGAVAAVIIAIVNGVADPPGWVVTWVIPIASVIVTAAGGSTARGVVWPDKHVTDLLDGLLADQQPNVMPAGDLDPVAAAGLD